MIVYEYPFNERIRTYLRLERLFGRLNELLPHDAALLHHYALTTLFEILDIAGRTDLKSEVMRDLEKQKSILSNYRGNPAVSEGVLEQLVGQIDHHFGALLSAAGKSGQPLIESEWLTAIRNRLDIPGGTCEFDLPAYHAWQHRPADQRRADILQWVSALEPLACAINLLVGLLRQTGHPHKAMAAGGQFQQALPGRGPDFELLRLFIDEQHGLIPEISGNRLMVSVRFLSQDAQFHLFPFTEDVVFELALCTFPAGLKTRLSN
ncbi:MAG: cell division protein ZapD [Burkholderiaceae bacterium]|nr:cell division protein ZapD [Burkholderiaceae bacterium]